MLPRGRIGRGAIAGLAASLLSAGAGCSTAVAPRAPDAAQPCTSEVGPGRVLETVRSARDSVPGQPFDVAITADGAWAFVSLGSSVGVFANDSFPPRMLGRVPVPGQALGEVLTSDGRQLIVADQSGVDVIDVAAATRPGPDAFVGALRPAAGGMADGTIEVVVSRDDHYVFVTRENDNDLAVFDLRKARREGYGPSAFVGAVALGTSPVGLALSPDGRYLYATSQAGVAPSAAPGERRPTPRSPDEGSFSVIDTTKAVSDPTHAVVSTVLAGCNPVRVIPSADGRTLWATARASNAVLGFSAAKARTDPQHALVARVPVGQAPVGLVLFRHDTRLVVANSNRFSTPGSSASLSVVDTRAARRGREAVLGVIPSGAFPRELAVGADGRTLLATNYVSAELQSVDLTTVP